MRHRIAGSDVSFHGRGVVRVEAATLAKIMQLGGTMVSAPAPLPAFNNKVVGIAKDFDGYIIELVQQ
jgi:hypothetical protein